jgi:hypothetical protein
MKWIALIVLTLVVIVVLIAIVGSQLPRDHAASRTLRLTKTSPPDAWTAVMAATSASSVPVDVVEQDPPRRLVTKVKDTEKMFGGTWTIVVAPAGITITENGWVANPIFRFVSRYVMGHHATIDGVLKQVAEKLHEEAVLTGE